MTANFSPALPASGEPCLPARLRKPNLTGAELSEYLVAKFGIAIKPATFAKWRSVGGGPPYHKCSATPLYPVATADEWARARLGALKASTSDKEAAQ
jgi:hypothetical protein